MGRYTSVQAFSDSNTKLVSGYIGSSSSNSANESSDGGADGSSSSNSSSGNSNEGNNQIGVGKKLITERVHNVSGSCAGASSSEFDKYRAARNREIARLKSIELNDQQMVEAEINQQRINKNKREADERDRKNAEKRNKKKRKILKKRELMKLHRNGNTDGKQSSNDDDDDDDDNLSDKYDEIVDTVHNTSIHKIPKQTNVNSMEREVSNSSIAHDQSTDNITETIKLSSVHTYKRKTEQV